MATRRAILGVLRNFLGTYTSRHSEYDGYWLFGFLVADLGELRVDLLAPPADAPDAPLGVAVRSAAVKFADQVRKAGLLRPQIREAWLTIRKLPGAAVGTVNGVPCAGHNVSFAAGAVMGEDKCYEHTQVVFVAPHDAGVEMRSTRAAQPGATADRGGM